MSWLTRGIAGIGLMMGQRRRRSPIVKAALGQLVNSAGMDAGILMSSLTLTFPQPVFIYM